MVAGISTVWLLNKILCVFVLANSNGVVWKHSSVNGRVREHSLQAIPGRHDAPSSAISSSRYRRASTRCQTALALRLASRGRPAWRLLSYCTRRR